MHRGIVDLLDGNFRILEAFFVEIFLDRVTVGIDHELRKFATPLQLKFFVDQLGLFAFVHTHDIPFEYTGVLLQINFEIDAVTHRLGQNPYIGKIPLAPHFTHRRGDVVAREHDRIAFVQPRGVRDNLGIEELDTGDGHLVHDIAFRGIVVGYRCIGHPAFFVVSTAVAGPCATAADPEPTPIAKNIRALNLFLICLSVIFKPIPLVVRICADVAGNLQSPGQTLARRNPASKHR